MTEYEALLEHLGHSVEIVRYGDENASLECTDCMSVILDYGNPEYVEEEEDE